MIDKKMIFAVIVAALGYFVDVYDLIVFSVVRIQSLKDLGLQGEALTDTGVMILNIQMAGMLLGGIFWGVLGDKKGRLTILFGSIFLYSVANIANAFATSVEQYAVCRFLAGIGLAGEIGAGITLVAELLPKEKRGIGTAIVAAVGVAGGMTAALVGDFFAWKTAYLVGGGMGLALLALRVTVAESGMFNSVAQKNLVKRGDLRLLLCTRSCLGRFMRCTLVGLPLWFIVGLIISLAPEIGRELGIVGETTAAMAVLYFYGGLVIGDFGSGLLSQFLGSRRKALGFCILGSLLGVLLILNLPAVTAETFYWLCAVTGIFSGYWAMFLTTTAEHFGTDLRATVTTSAPNLVRGGAILLTSAFAAMKGIFGIIPSLEIIALFTFGAALLSVYLMRETFGIDLDYVEGTARS